MPLSLPDAPARAAVVAVPTASLKDAVPYQPQFDSLRALAVLTVTSDHFAAAIPNFPLPDSIHLGPTAVRLFLVLSGYFITASLRRTRDQLDARRLAPSRAFGTFYLRRFLRILPPYGLFVALGLILNLGVMRERIGWIVTFTVNLLIAKTDEFPLAVAHLWSICVQEQFYLVWPVLILLLPRRWVLGAIIATALAGVGFRVGCVLWSVPLLARWVLPFGSLDALAGGAALAWISWTPSSSAPRWHRLAGGAAALLALTVAGILRDGDPSRLPSVLVEPLETLALVWLVAQTQLGWHGWLGHILTWPPLLSAGRIAYGIYIYHILVAICFDQWLPAPFRWFIENPVVRLVTLTGVTLGFASLSWRYLEGPINRWRRAGAPRRV